MRTSTGSSISTGSPAASDRSNAARYALIAPSVTEPAASHRPIARTFDPTRPEQLVSYGYDDDGQQTSQVSPRLARSRMVRLRRDGDVREDAVELLEGLLHRVLQARALAHLLGEVDGDDLGVALRLEAVTVPLEPALPLKVVRELAVVDDGDVGERIGPVGVGVGDVDVGLGRHARVADGMGADDV